MNIQDAAILLQNGIFVRRKTWKDTQRFMGLDEAGIYIRSLKQQSNFLMHYHLQIEDLIANDWEVFLY